MYWDAAMSGTAKTDTTMSGTTMTNETTAEPWQAEACGKSDAEIIAMAEALRAESKYETAVFLHLLATQMGGKIEITTEADLTRKPGQLVVSKKNDFTIYNPIGWSSKNERYMIANEIAHVNLHFIEGREGQMFANFDKNSNNLVDLESLLYARFLIMPTEEFKKSFNFWLNKIKNDESIENLSLDELRQRLVHILSDRFLVDEDVVLKHINKLELKIV